MPSTSTSASRFFFAVPFRLMLVPISFKDQCAGVYVLSMSTALLRRYITEVLADMDQNIVRKDPAGNGHLIIRKLVTYEKPASRFAPGDDVDTELKSDGSVKVDDLETWKPDFDSSARKPTRKVKHTTKLA